MPSLDRRTALSLDGARRRAGERAFGGAGGGRRVGQVGLEPEFFPVLVDPGGRPAGRVRLHGREGVIETLDALAASEPALAPRQGPPLGPWEYALGDGGRLTFEPGAQVEHSTAVHASPAAALADVEQVLGLLRTAFAVRSANLVAAGLDLWHELESVPQQLTAKRYTAMAAYYERRGPWGRVMMRHTASLQLNLDLGPDGVWQERWLLANLLAPLEVASFACSPADGAVCKRARAWQELDPTRTGFPRRLLEGDDDPRAEFAEAALAADVMLIRGADGAYEAGRPGFSFADWIERGHPAHGWPTADDLDYHLTTLFFEVRPRGFLELRSGEALPDRWRPAPVVLLTTLLYDDRARQAALARLADCRPRLDELWRRAAVDGVRDPELGRLAGAAWELALAATGRFPAGYFGERAVASAQAFVERFTARGLMPADELAALQAEDPARALAWAATGAVD